MPTGDVIGRYNPKNIRIIAYVGKAYSQHNEKEILNSEEDSLIKTTPTSIVENNLDSRVLVYPNPANNYVVITVMGKTNHLGSWKLMDISGKVIQTKSYPNNIISSDLINTAGISEGFYFI